MKTRLLPFLLLCFTTLACAQSDIIPLFKKRSDDTINVGFNTGAKTVKISAAGTLEWVSGATLTGASDFRTAAGLAIGSNVQAYDADLTTIAALAHAAGVLTDNGSGVYSYTATSTGGNGTDDSGKIVKFNSLGQIAGGFVGSFEAGPSYDFVAMDEGLFIGSETNSGRFGIPTSGGTGLVWTMPGVTGTLVSTGDTGSVTNTMLAGSIALTKLLQTSATSGQVIAWNGTAWAPATISSGLTIGSTAISGGTSGRLMMNNAGVLSELALGSGIATWLATPNETNLKAAQSGLAWLDTAQTFTAAQTVTAPANASGMTINGSLTGGGVTRSVLKVTDDWSAATGGTSSGTLLDLAVNDTGGAPNYGATRAIKFSRNGVELFYINHGGSMFIAGGVSVDGNYQTFEMPAAYGLRWGGWQTSLYRDIAGILHQRSENGTYAQSFRVNNTFTSTTNFEAGVMDWQTTTNTLRIGTDVGSGGGTARDVKLIRGGVVKATIDANTTAHEQPVKLKSYIVSGLPSASTCGAGSMAFVTDATATTAYSTVAGGGSNKVLVISDGTDWIIH